MEENKAIFIWGFGHVNNMWLSSEYTVNSNMEGAVYVYTYVCISLFKEPFLSKLFS